MIDNKEDLEKDVCSRSPMMTRERKRVLEGVPRRTFTQYGRKQRTVERETNDVRSRQPLDSLLDDLNSQLEAQEGEKQSTLSNFETPAPDTMCQGESGTLESTGQETMCQGESGTFESPERDTMCQGESGNSENLERVPPLDVSLHDSCDTNASTLPLDNDQEGWRVNEIEPGEESCSYENLVAEVFVTQELTTLEQTERNNLRLQELPTTDSSEKVKEWQQRHWFVWDNFPASLLMPWEDMSLPLVSPTRNAALVGTPINVLGGGEVKRERQEVLTLNVNSEIKIDKITFTTEKISEQPRQRETK